MKNLLDLNDQPLSDNHEPELEGARTNPSMQGGQPGIRVPKSHFEPSYLPHGHPAPSLSNPEERNSYDVYFYNHYDNVIMRSPTPFYHEPLGGPTSSLAHGGQNVAPADDNGEDNYDDVAGDNDEDSYLITSPTPFNHESERCLTNPMGQVSQPDIHHVPIAPVERNIQSRGSPRPGSVDMVELDGGDDDDVDNEDEDDDEDEDDAEDDQEDDEDIDDDYSENNYEEDEEVVVAVGDDDDDMTMDFQQMARNSQSTLGRTLMINSESASYTSLVPTNHMAQRVQLGVQVFMAPVDQQSLPAPGFPPPWSIDVVELDNDEDNEEEEYADDDEHDDDDGSHNDEDVAAGDDVVIISPPEAFGVALSSRTQGRTPVIDLESGEIADNYQRNTRRRTDSQPPVHVHDFNMHFQETRTSMPKPVASPPSPPPPPLPAYNCPICMGPLVEPMIPKCGHMFCEGCIRAAISVQAKCPLCRHKVNHRELFRVYFPTCD